MAAYERAAQVYGAQVFTAANAFLATAAENTLTDGLCLGGVTLGGYTVADPGAAVSDCALQGGAEGRDPLVEVESITGAVFVFGP